MRKQYWFVMWILVSVISILWAGGGKEAAGTKSAGERPILKVWAVKAAEVPLNPKEIDVWKRVEEKTGLDLRWEFVSSLAQTKDQQFNLIMVSGNLPDIMAYYQGQGGHEIIYRYGQEGAFLPLEDLIVKHAPNLKRVLLDDPAIRDAITAPDGHVYLVPMLSALNAARGWFIRYDWLKKVGMSAPKTTEDLYKVLVAFRDKDPNGNGKKDEIPMIARRRGDDWDYNIGALAYAFDADTSWVVRNGKVVFGPSEPQYRDYLEYIQKLYGEKLLDQEVLTRAGNPRDELLGRDLAGCLHDWFASTADLNDKLASKIPGFELRHFAPPVGTAKKPYTRIQMSKVRNDGGWVISAKTKYPVEIIKMMDFLFSEEGNRLMNFGIEGVHYTLVGGKPKYTDLIRKNPQGLGFHEALVTAGCQWKIGFAQSIDYESQFANAIGTAARLDYMNNYIIEEFPALTFTEAETEVLKDKYTHIKTFASEMAAKVMVGGIKVSEWEGKVISKMREMGLDEVTRIYQAAYDRKKSKK